jgi:transcriptional regulator with XRE-family HTH domain
MDVINQQVAERLRRLRTDAGLSLEQLADRSGVSRAMLSQIETLKANPTIAMLWKVAQGLEVSFAELLGPEPAPTTRLARAAGAKYLYSDDRSFRSRPLLARVPGHRIEIYELRLAARRKHVADPHPPGTREQIIVTAGQLALTVNEETYELDAGDTLLFPADRDHTYQARGRAAFNGLSVILYDH